MADDDFSPPADALDFSSAQDAETGAPISSDLFSSGSDTGAFGDILSNPPLRAMSYGPGVDKPTRATTEGRFGKLQQGDIAVSPGLLGQYPMGTRWNVVDQSGKVLMPNVRVADTSWFKPGSPTTNTFEVWGRGKLPYDYAHLAPINGQSSENPVENHVQSPDYLQALSQWLTSIGSWVAE